jgi:hypothetical protein
MLLEERRKAQAVADSAALAAAEDLFRNYPANKGTDPDGLAAKKALAIAAGNGYTNNGTTSKVDVRVNPQKYAGGPDAGSTIPAGYAEVSVQYNQPRYFSAVMGTSSVPVTARAVARGIWEPNAIGIHVLDLDTKAALTAVGGGTMTVTGGASVIVNSQNSEAAVAISGILKATQWDIAGGSTGSGFEGTMNYGIQPQPDPLRYLPQPDPSTLTQQSNHKLMLNSPAPKTLSPGVYKGGIAITGNGNVKMLPGVYYMDGGGFTFGAGGNLVGEGVMIYSAPKNPGDQISITGNSGGGVKLSPPTSGPFKGVSLFQERTSGNPVSVSGNGNFDITGTFYAANAQVKVSGNGETAIGSQYVSRYLAVTGTGDFKVHYDAGLVAPTRTIGLVE